MAWESENFISVNTQSDVCLICFSFSPAHINTQSHLCFSTAHIASQVVIGEHTIRSDYSVSDDDDYDGIRLKDKVTTRVMLFL